MKYFLEVRNKSHYIADHSSQSFRLPNPKVWSVQSAKQLSYFTRLYYHYKEVVSNGGYAFFYTLTYNNKALPHFLGQPCFNHDDFYKFVRSSGFDKKLKRNYGLILKYFVTCELGEGKGSRGIDGNPHYHVIFFLTPDPKTKLDSCSITPIEFKHLVCTYWCGDDYSDKRYCDYKYGIAMPGDNLGEIISPAALNYCTKYITKNSAYLHTYTSLKDEAYKHIVDYIENTPAVQLKLCNIKYREQFSPCQFAKYYNNLIDWCFKRFYYRRIMRLHMPKVISSQGIGLACINFVHSDGLTISIPKPMSKIVSVSLPMYVYRKMYYDVVKDAKGNNKYVLNSNGIDLRVKNLDKSINRKYHKILPILKHFNVDIPSFVVKDYCLYDIVYRNRTCRDYDVVLSPVDDYRKFLNSEYFFAEYKDDDSASFTLIMNKINYPIYKYHDYFLNNVKYFEEIDNLLDKYYIFDSDCREEVYKQIAKTKCLFAKDKFNRHLSNL